MAIAVSAPIQSTQQTTFTTINVAGQSLPIASPINSSSTTISPAPIISVKSDAVAGSSILESPFIAISEQTLNNAIPAQNSSSVQANQPDSPNTNTNTNTSALRQIQSLTDEQQNIQSRQDQLQTQQQSIEKEINQLQRKELEINRQRFQLRQQSTGNLLNIQV